MPSAADVDQVRINPQPCGIDHVKNWGSDSIILFERFIYFIIIRDIECVQSYDVEIYQRTMMRNEVSKDEIVLAPVPLFSAWRHNHIHPSSPPYHPAHQRP